MIIDRSKSLLHQRLQVQRLLQINRSIIQEQLCQPPISFPRSNTFKIVSEPFVQKYLAELSQKFFGVNALAIVGNGFWLARCFKNLLIEKTTEQQDV